VIYLTLPELLHVAGRTLGPDYTVRDYGLLEAALARPRATAFGKDAYPDPDAKGARRPGRAAGRCRRRR
jgi:death-on-curing protein